VDDGAVPRPDTDRRRLMRVLGLIPARGGSKGVPRKNLADVGGRPLISFAVETALRVERLDRVIVSTDDEEIAAVARAYGAETPFLRPPTIANDAAPMLGVVHHALRTLADDGDAFDAVCLLQPTSPLRPVALVDGCIEALEAKGATSVVTVHPVPFEHHPSWTLTVGPSGFGVWPDGALDPIARRQDLTPTFHRNGLVYVTRAEVVERGSLYGEAMVLARTDSIPLCNVDSNDDLAQLRMLVAKGAWDELSSAPFELPDL
jgi:CMP-N,N'-diacetyllegionaminic acid synthase